MLKNLKLSLVAVAVLGLTGCFSKSIEIKKTQLTEDGVEFSENFVFENNIYKIMEKDILSIDKLIEDQNSFSNFNSLNFNNIKSIENYDFNLSQNKLESDIIYARDKVLYEINKVRNQKELEVDRELSILKSEHLSSVKDLESFDDNIERYMHDLQPLIDQKNEINKKLEESKRNIARWSSSLALDINDFLIKLGEKGDIDSNHFTKVIEERFCDEDFLIKKNTVNFYKSIDNICVMTYVPIKIENSEKFLENYFLFEKTKETLEKISNEMIKQGLIKTPSIPQFEKEYADLEKKLSAAYKKTENKYNVTRYQLEGKKSLLNDVVKEKEIKIEEEKALKEQKINSKMKREDLNKFKSIMFQSEKEYINKITSSILNTPFSSDRKHFDLIKIKQDQEVNEVFIIVDKYNSEKNNYLDVVVVDLNDLDRVLGEPYKGKIIPIDVAEGTSQLYRYSNNQKQDSLFNGLVKAKELLERN